MSEAPQAPGDRDRERLVEADRQSMQDFDKAVLTISGGALAVSVAFIKDIAHGPNVPSLLALAWAAFTISIVSILVSNYSSHWALVKALVDLDKDQAGAVQGGCFTWVTEGLNVLALGSLLLGLVMLLGFSFLNLPVRGAIP